MFQHGGAVLTIQDLVLKDDELGEAFIETVLAYWFYYAEVG